MTVFSRRQIAILSVIVLVSFLIGTLLNANFIVLGGDGGPWGKVWDAISELQDHVGIIERKLNQSKTLRFTDISEHEISNTDWRDVSVFTWIPQDQTNNALLYASYYFEYSKTIPEPTRLLYKLVIWNATAQMWEEISGLNYCSENYALNPMRPYVMNLYPNQEVYVFKFQAAVDFGIARVININIIITVVDGLPDTNP